LKSEFRLAGKNSGSNPQVAILVEGSISIETGLQDSHLVQPYLYGKEKGIRMNNPTNTASSNKGITYTKIKGAIVLTLIGLLLPVALGIGSPLA